MIAYLRFSGFLKCSISGINSQGNKWKGGSVLDIIEDESVELAKEIVEFAHAKANSSVRLQISLMLALAANTKTLMGEKFPDEIANVLREEIKVHTLEDLARMIV